MYSRKTFISNNHRNLIENKLKLNVLYSKKRKQSMSTFFVKSAFQMRVFRFQVE